MNDNDILGGFSFGIIVLFLGLVFYGVSALVGISINNGILLTVIFMLIASIISVILSLPPIKEMTSSILIKIIFIIAFFSNALMPMIVIYGLISLYILPAGKRLVDDFSINDLIFAPLGIVVVCIFILFIITIHILIILGINKIACTILNTKRIIAFLILLFGIFISVKWGIYIIGTLIEMDELLPTLTKMYNTNILNLLQKIGILSSQ